MYVCMSGWMSRWMSEWVSGNGYRGKCMGWSAGCSGWTDDQQRARS